MTDKPRCKIDPNNPTRLEMSIDFGPQLMTPELAAYLLERHGKVRMRDAEFASINGERYLVGSVHVAVKMSEISDMSRGELDTPTLYPVEEMQE